MIGLDISIGPIKHQTKTPGRTFTAELYMGMKPAGLYPFKRRPFLGTSTGIAVAVCVLV
jgi:hypothetical protein